MRTATIFTLVACLLGTAYIQYRFVVTDLRLAWLSFEQQMDQAQAMVSWELQEPNRLSNLILGVLTPENPGFDLPPDSLRDATVFFLRNYLEGRLQQVGVTTPFEFGLFDGQQLVLPSAGFAAGAASQAIFEVPLRGYPASMCQCVPSLRLQVRDMPWRLLRRRTELVVPALLLLLLAVASTTWLVFTLRRQRRLDQLKTDFINNLTHELKTPVFSISLATRMLEENPDGPQRSTYLRMIRQENKKLKQHVEMVLALAALENGKTAIQPQLTDLNATIEALLPAFALRVTERQGQLDFLPESPACLAWVDPAHVANAIHNLIDNALKYSPGRVQVQIRSYHQEKQVAVSITDQGIGIPAAEQKRIFDKFHRVSAGDRHETEGFGLGLSYVRQVMTKHQGEIQLQSEAGKGATFTLLFPAASVT